MSKAIETTKQYNGWTNYETWSVHLCLSNVQQWDQWARELAGRTYEFPHQRADAFQEWVENLLMPPGGNDVAIFRQQMIGAALCEVDWASVARAFMD